MKKIVLIIAGILILSVFDHLNAQIISESARRKVTVGVDVFTDIWFNTPENVKLRTVNQGSDVYAQYNFSIGNSKRISFAAGIGIDNHNMYSNARISSLTADTIVFVPIEGDYRRSKINVVSVNAPLELKFRWENGIKLSVGMKLGYVFDSKEKFVGSGPRVNEKRKGIYQLETFTYSPTIRFGYKFINIFAQYQLNSVFRLGHGPQLQPLSVGITITPF